MPRHNLAGTDFFPHFLLTCFGIPSAIGIRPGLRQPMNHCGRTSTSFGNSRQITITRIMMGI